MNPIKQILTKKIPVVFLSPHMDDAILSCGALITNLNKKTEIKIINVFTTVSEKLETKFARKFVAACGYKDSQKLFKDRKREEKKLFNKLGLKSTYLDFIDAAWRKKPESTSVKIASIINPEFIHIYSKEVAVFSGIVSRIDKDTMIRVERKLLKLVGKIKAVIFCPIGRGRHVDHIIIREICRKNFKNVVYWSDFPYSINSQVDIDFIKKNSLSSFSWDKNLENKEKLIREYKTQFNSLFPSGIILLIDEVYYFSPKFFQID